MRTRRIGLLAAAQRNRAAPTLGAARPDHMQESLGCGAAERDPVSLARLEALINAATVSGPRYNPATQAKTDTEELPA